ncbi:YfcE family phosphodiesterase [Virgibacillus profundi]|uniref:Phosphoesterase n=1 Tax=Virgibacillus profundi TaxID=2024555 RepID=A0A2A2I6S7_9BACI|nr:metallophosphoesterase [Virgibacillus profundi]PAV27711.1 YfcE family phosphodiesterase [Virgibacillus profundi]PXY51866.1 metallophosphoesterase [Virgibacillus profundi]
MTKVLIISDSHGLTEEFAHIKERHQLKYMIHCGDSELGPDDPLLDDFYKVGGNCDFDPRYPEEQLINIDGLRFFVTHGHLHHVKTNLMTISYRAKEENAQVICFGHTHIAGAEHVDKQLFINPGSIRMPRNRKEKTYAIMEWDSPEDVTVNFYSIDGKPVEELKCNASF